MHTELQVSQLLCNGEKPLADWFGQWASVKPIERVKLSELSTASALDSLYQMGSMFSPLFNLWERREGKIKRKGKGERRWEGGKPVLQPEEHGQNFSSEWQIQISSFAIKALKTLQEIYTAI